MQQTLAQLVRAKYPGAYDDLSDQQLESSVKAKYPGQYDDLPLSGAKPEKSKDRQSGLATLGDFVLGALKGGGETAVNLGAMLHKIPGVSSAVDALYGQEGLSDAAFPAARAAMQPTNTAQSIGKGVEQFAELVVPAAKVSQAAKGLSLGGRMLAEGAGGAAMNVAQGQSATAGGVIGAAIPGVGAAVRGARSLLRGAGASPVVRDAVEWGARQGIPVDAATATGAPIVRAIQGAADATPLGGVIASKARNQADEALTRTGRSLAQSVNPSPQDYVSAGEAIQGRLGQVMKDSAAQADEAYSRLRAIEAKSKTMVPVRQAKNVIMEDGTRTTGQVLGHVPMAVDIGAARTQLQPVYQRMMRAAELAQPMGAEARALQALDRLMRSEGQHAPLSVVDDALSDLKGVLRSAPDKLGKGAGALSSVVASLDAQVLAAAKRAGPEAVEALKQGRAATVQKYVAADLAERLGKEPGALAKRVSGPDTHIRLLRDVAKEAPAELPKLGRAFVDDLLETATAEGGFSRSAGVFQKWQNLGDETKKLLFKPDVKQDLDRFFLLAKRMGESPNPSQSATMSIGAGSGVMAFLNPMTGVPMILGAGALSKLLHSPKGAKLLTQAMSTPKTATTYPSLLSALGRAAGLEASQMATGR